MAVSDADIVYPPVDVPKPVAENVWIVDSGPIRIGGLSLPDNKFTIYKAGSPSLTQINSLASYTAPRTITWQDASGTVPFLGSAQTWSATQTFSSTAKIVATALTSTNTSGSDIV